MQLISTSRFSSRLPAVSDSRIETKHARPFRLSTALCLLAVLLLSTVEARLGSRLFPDHPERKLDSFGSTWSALQSSVHSSSLTPQHSSSLQLSTDTSLRRMLDASLPEQRARSTAETCSSYAFARQFSMELTLDVAADFSEDDERALERAFLADYNNLVDCDDGTGQLTRYLSNVTLNATRYGTTEVDQEYVILQGQARGFCSGCLENTTLFAPTTAGSPCACDGIPKEDFETVFTSTVTDFAGNGTLPTAIALESITELILSEECAATNRSDFSATSILDFEAVGNVNVGAEEEASLETALQLAFAVLTDVNSGICDPFAYDITSIEVLGTSASNGSGGRRSLFRKAATNTPSRLLSHGTHDTFSPAEVESSIPSSSPFPTSTPGPTITGMPSPLPSGEPTIAIAVSFSVLFAVTGTCRGCDNNVFLGNDVSGGGRRPRSLVGGSRRRLADSDNADDCLCATDAEVRTLSGNEFAVSVSDFAQEDESLNFIVTADEVYEVEVITCNATVTNITVLSSIEIFLAEDTNLTAREEQILSDTYEEAYKEVSEKYCFTAFPEVDDVVVVSAIQIPNATDDNSTSSSEHLVTFEVAVSYRETGDEFGLFVEDTSNSTRRLYDTNGMAGAFRRVMIEDDICYCAVDAEGEGPPPFDEFLSVFYAKLDDLVRRGAFASIYTDPARSPSAVPTSLIISAESEHPSMVPSSGPSFTPSDIPSRIPSDQPSDIPSMAPSDQPTLSPSTTPSSSPSSFPTSTPSHAPSRLPSVSPSTSPSVMPSLSPSASPSDPPSLSSAPSASPSDVPSVSPSAVPSFSSEPSDQPSTVPSESPSDVPSLSSAPSDIPSRPPSDAPSHVPSLSSAPSSSPSTVPSDTPTNVPSLSSVPSDQPSHSPSSSPSAVPSLSLNPSDVPSDVPSDTPSDIPSLSSSPSVSPSDHPSASPSGLPSLSSNPSDLPSEVPSLSLNPSASPSTIPSLSLYPSLLPSEGPSLSLRPSSSPSDVPSESPSDPPSLSSSPSEPPSLSSAPSSSPSESPSLSLAPSDVPSMVPSESPSNPPSQSSAPSKSPSDEPSMSSFPSSSPSASPSESSIPSSVPSVEPSLSSNPSVSPSDAPSALPSDAPSRSLSPSESPTFAPSKIPSDRPTTTFRPSDSPSRVPSYSGNPSVLPSRAPSVSSAPSEEPSLSPSDFRQIDAFANEIRTWSVVGSSMGDFIEIASDISVDFSNDFLCFYSDEKDTDLPTLTLIPSLTRLLGPIVPYSVGSGVKLTVVDWAAGTFRLATSEYYLIASIELGGCGTATEVIYEFELLVRPERFSLFDTPEIADQYSLQSVGDCLSVDRVFDAIFDTPTRGAVNVKQSFDDCSPDMQQGSFPALAPGWIIPPDTSAVPSNEPSLSSNPSDTPSEQPSVSANPSESPSEEPSLSSYPSDAPSKQPSLSPSSVPSDVPSQAPSGRVIAPRINELRSWSLSGSTVGGDFFEFASSRDWDITSHYLCLYYLLGSSHLNIGFLNRRIWVEGTTNYVGSDVKLTVVRYDPGLLRRMLIEFDQSVFLFAQLETGSPGCTDTPGQVLWTEYIVVEPEQTPLVPGADAVYWDEYSYQYSGPCLQSLSGSYSLNPSPGEINAGQDFVDCPLS